MFFSNAARNMLSSLVSRTIAGIVSSPACCAARQRRSPITSWYLPAGSGVRTTIGCLKAELRDGAPGPPARLLVDRLPRLPRVRDDQLRVDFEVHGADGRQVAAG